MSKNLGNGTKHQLSFLGFVSFQQGSRDKTKTKQFYSFIGALSTATESSSALVNKNPTQTTGESDF